MKRIAFIAIGIMVIGTAQLSAQVEFIDQMGIGFSYGFVEDKNNSEFNFNLDYLLGVHIHSWNTAILAGIRFANLADLDIVGQVEHFFGFFNSRSLTGFGASLAGGVSFSDGDVVPFIRPGAFWHMATMIKVSLELDYRFNGQISAGIMLSLPSATVFSRLEAFQRMN